jgi:hypothetical protein
MDMDMDMADTDMVDADGGAQPSITRLAGEDGMEVPDRMAFMAIIFTCTITYMLITPTMFTGTGAVYPARVIIARVELPPERRIIIARQQVQPDRAEMRIQDQIVQGPETVITITDLRRTDRQPEGQAPQAITLPMDLNDLPYIPTVREMFINGLSQTATGNKDKTGPGRR